MLQGREAPGGAAGQVLAPYDAEDARGLLKAAIRDPDPIVFLENEILYGESFPVSEKVLDPDFVVPIGKAKARGALCLLTLHKPSLCCLASCHGAVGVRVVFDETCGKV